MFQLPSGPGFFTLTELVRHWTDQDADEQTLASRRRTVRDNTVNSGCPHVKVGTETVFRMESFLQWLSDNEEGMDPASE